MIVQSSTIKELDYNSALNRLSITFVNGDLYYYYDVPSDVYLQVLNANSIGSAFHSLIKNNYNYAKQFSSQSSGSQKQRAASGE